MEPFHLAHLLALGMWAGVVVTEVLFEFTGSDPDSLRAAARFHYALFAFRRRIWSLAAFGATFAAAALYLGLVYFRR